MLDLILKILLFAAMAYAAFSIIRMYVRRLARRIRKLNYDTVGAKAHIPLVGFLLSVVFSILSIYELFIEERAKYYRDGGDDLFFVIVSVACLIWVASCASSGILYDDNGILKHTVFQISYFCTYAQITGIDFSYNEIWYDNNGTDSIVIDGAFKDRKRLCIFANEKYCQLYGHDAPTIKQGVETKHSEQSVRKKSDLMTAVAAFLPLAFPLIAGCIAFGLLVYNDTKTLTKENTDYYEITLAAFITADFYDYAVDDKNDCTIYCYSPELDYSIPLGSGMAWAEKDGETLTHTDVHGHLYFDHFGRTMEQLMAECDGNTKFDMYGKYWSIYSKSTGSRSGYDVYYLADENGTVYIDDFDKENQSRQKYKPVIILFWGVIVGIITGVVYYVIVAKAVIDKRSKET